ncbi:UMP-CMP kinase 2, mitochondrial-like isoform X1 [Macrosteles quadrilineatus]|nr:UMP-CMP kinase 2, mitochondrial-like isoform X1 [Macrosteles quadrilineatus]
MPQYRRLPQVKEILEEYQYNCKLRDMNSLPKKYPLIVIEAPRRRKRFLVAKRLAKELDAAIMFSPPLGWSKFREAFNRSIEMRRAFHSLSIYGSANNAMQYLGRKPVVMSGFWMDQATFAIAKKYFPNFPPQNSSVFQWPKDLIKPDYTFFINEPLPRSFTENKEESIRYQILQVYRHWADPPVIELYMDDEVKVATTVEDILRYINSPHSTTVPSES